MGEAREVMEDIDEAGTSLYELLRSSDAASLAELPPSDEWSPIENVRHLLFAEQLYLGRYLPDGFTWSGLGLRPRSLANEEAFSEVGREPTTDIEAVFRAWNAVHAPIREVVSEDTEGVQRRSRVTLTTRNITSASSNRYSARRPAELMSPLPGDLSLISIP